MLFVAVSAFRILRRDKEEQGRKLSVFLCAVAYLLCSCFCTRTTKTISKLKALGRVSHSRGLRLNIDWKLINAELELGGIAAERLSEVGKGKRAAQHAAKPAG